MLHVIIRKIYMEIFCGMKNNLSGEYDIQAPYERSIMPNGLRVITASMPATRSISAALYIGTGSRYEEDSEAGVSHYLEHMLFKGTNKRPHPKDVSEEIERVGGYINASTDKELTIYVSRVARPHLPVAIDLLSDMLLNSKFEINEIEKERQVILEEIHQINDIPSQKSFLLSEGLMWPNQAIGRDIAGTPESVRGITKTMMLDYMGKQYSPNNISLVVAGQVSHAEIEDLVHDLSEMKNSSQSRDMVAALNKTPEKRLSIEYRKTEQASICLSFPALSVMDPDRHPLDLLSAILGEGMASRLFLQLREEQGLVYDVGTSVSKLRDTGSMTIYAGTEPKNAPKAIRGIIDELSRVSNDLKESELNRARELLKGRLLLGLEDTRGISSWLGYQETLMDQIYTPEDVVKSLDSVTVEDIKRVASKLFRNDLYRLAVVGPFRSEKRFQKILENIG